MTFQPSLMELGGVARLEGYLLQSRVAADPVHFLQVDHAAVLARGVVATAHIYNVVAHVFSHHEPGASAQAETLALAYGIEPVTAVFAYLTACLDFDDGTGACAEVPFYEVGVVNLAEEADALRCLLYTSPSPRDA